MEDSKSNNPSRPSVNPFEHSEQAGQRSNQAQFPQFDGPQPFARDEVGMSFDGDITKRIEAAKSNGWGAQLSSYISARKKPILVAAIAILLFASGTYLSKNDEDANPEKNVAGINEIDDDDNGNNDNGDDVNVNESVDEQSKNGIDIQPDKNDRLVIEEIGPTLPEEPTPKKESVEDKSSTQKSNDGITISAGKGEGITHLARKALKEYLDEKKQTLMPEQLIYGEDYIQNRIGSELLEIGQKLSFSHDLIQEAIEKSKSLNESQLENLTRYTDNISLN